MKVVNIVLITVSIIVIIGTIIGLQQIVIWQAQTTFDQYNLGYQIQEDSPTVTIEQPSLQECLGNARCITGIVTQVIDGDTVTVDGQSIRFALVSTPELYKSDGIVAKDFISDICPVGSIVTVDEDDGQTAGSYDGILGVVYCNGKNLNEQLLESGFGSLSSEFCSISEFSNNTWVKKYGC